MPRVEARSLVEGLNEEKRVHHFISLGEVPYWHIHKFRHHVG
jgi:hypothetical protein